MSGCTNCGRSPARRARFCDHCGQGIDRPGVGVDGVGQPFAHRSGRSRSAGTRIGVAVIAGLVTVGAIMTLGVGGIVGGTTPTIDGSEVELDGTTAVRDLDAEDERVEPVGAPDCATPAGLACAVPFDDDRDLVAAVPLAGDDVLLLDADRRLRRVGMPEGAPGAARGELRVHWERTLDDAAPIDPTDGAQVLRTGGPRVTVDDRLALIGDAGGVSAVALEDGTRLWRVQLPVGSDAAAYRAWRMDGHVLAANRFHLAAVDLDRGEISWSIERPPGDVQPIDGGLAIVAPDVVHGFVPTSEEPVWRSRRAAPNRAAFGVVGRPVGPVVIDGRAAVTLDPTDGRVLVEHGTASVTTRAGDGTVVAAEWDAISGSPQLAGYAPDGTRRWRTDGPDVRCCELLLRPTQDGRVLAATIGRGRTEVGWLIDPVDGRVTATVRRPALTSVLPIAVGEGTSVWLDGDALVGAALDTGEVRWRATTGTVLLSESPLLLHTGDGLVRP